MGSTVWPAMRRAVMTAALVATAVAAAAQAPTRIAISTEWLVASPFFFHGKQIVVRQPFTTTPTVTRLEGTAKPVYIFWRERPTRSEGEIRGEFWDLGRMQEGDSRFSTYDFAPVVEEANKGRWPARDQVFVILGASLSDNPAPTSATIRGIALAPEQSDGRTVTVSGRFKGRNLYGDLPQAIGKSRWDFILQSADGAIWVSGLRPKGKDFDLDPTARVDTGRWLEVTGIVHREGPIVWIAATSLKLAAAPTDTEPVEVIVPTPAEPPPIVIFSAPTSDETDVAVGSTVRVQFSRDMNGKTFTGRIRIRYSGVKPPPVAPPPFTVAYNDGNRAIEIRFKEPLERFQTITVELQEGITAADGQPLAPFVLSFSTGG